LYNVAYSWTCNYQQ